MVLSTTLPHVNFAWYEKATLDNWGNCKLASFNISQMMPQQAKSDWTPKKQLLALWLATLSANANVNLTVARKANVTALTVHKYTESLRVTLQKHHKALK